jgi:hypothetical protein
MHFDNLEKFTPRHDEKLHDLVNVLDPVQQVVLTLSKAETYLVVAEASIKYLSEKLKSLSSSLSLRMLASLEKRYLE